MGSLPTNLIGRDFCDNSWESSLMQVKPSPKNSRIACRLIGLFAAATALTMAASVDLTQRKQEPI